MVSKFGFRNNDSEKHWQRCNLEDIKITKPLIVCLSGNSTNTELEANGFCKLAESLLEDKAKDVDIMGVAYGESDGNRFKLSNDDIESFVNNVLLPLCKNKQTGEMFSIDECCRNLSLVTFFTFCHGSTEVSNILNNFSNKLQDKGFTKDDLKKIKEAFVEVSYANENIDVSCPQISVASAGDSAGSLFEYWYFDTEEEYEVKMKNRYSIVCDKPGQFCGKDFPLQDKRKFGSILLIANSILNQNTVDDSWSVQSNEHNVGYFKKVRNEFHPALNEEGKVLRQGMSLSLQKRVENSLTNLNNNKFSRFYLLELDSFLNNNLPEIDRYVKPKSDNLISEDSLNLI